MGIIFISNEIFENELNFSCKKMSFRKKRNGSFREIKNDRFLKTNEKKKDLKSFERT